MQERYIRVQFLRGGVPKGDAYTYKTSLDVQLGEVVMVTEKAKGVIVGFATRSMVIVPEDVKEIFGQIEREC